MSKDIQKVLLERNTLSKKLDIQAFLQEGLLCQKVELIAQLSATIKGKAEVLEYAEKIVLVKNVQNQVQ